MKRLLKVNCLIMAAAILVASCNVTNNKKSAADSLKADSLLKDSLKKDSAKKAAATPDTSKKDTTGKTGSTPGEVHPPGTPSK